MHDISTHINLPSQFLTLPPQKRTYKEKVKKKRTDEIMQARDHRERK
jgi:hypothetical protein